MSASASDPVRFEDVPWLELSETGRDILEAIAVPISNGAKLDELAAELNLTRKEILERLDQLAGEVRCRSKAWRRPTGQSRAPSGGPAPGGSA